jgi:hypothetical protein
MGASKAIKFIHAKTANMLALKASRNRIVQRNRVIKEEVKNLLPIFLENIRERIYESYVNEEFTVAIRTDCLTCYPEANNKLVEKAKGRLTILGYKCTVDPKYLIISWGNA